MIALHHYVLICRQLHRHRYVDVYHNLILLKVLILYLLARFNKENILETKETKPDNSRTVQEIIKLIKII